MTAITDTKLRDKLMKKKKRELKKTIEIIKQNTYKRKNRKNTIPEALITNRKKMKEEPIQKMERFGPRPKNRTTKEKPCKLCNAPNWNPSQKCTTIDKLCNNCGRKGHFERACKHKENIKGKTRNITEEETTMIGNESESSIYRIEKKNRITDKEKYLTT